MPVRAAADASGMRSRSAADSPAFWLLTLIVVATAVAGAAILGVGVLGESAARVMSDAVYVPVSLGAGLLIIVGARQADRRERRAWRLVGAGVVALGIGETAWSAYGFLGGTEPPYPGLPDAAYLGGYVLMTMGIFAMPHARPSGHERTRLVLDALAGTLAIGLVAWRFLFEPIYLTTRDAPIAELVVGFGYPVGDVLMLAAVVILSTRRGVFLHDGRLAAVAAALVVLTFGDTVYLVEEWYGAYTAGTWLDSTWLLSYGLFALAGGMIAREGPVREVTEGHTPAWQAAIPYAAVAFLFVVFATDLARVGLSGSQTTLTLGVFLVIVVVLVRQWVAGRENRELVERERRHLVSVVSHELRTPLTAIGGFLDLLNGDTGDLPENERKEMLGIAFQQTRYLGRIVKDLIEVSRDEIHAGDLRFEDVPLDEAVSNALRAVPEASDQRVTMTIDPALVVRADPDRLSQVLGNLITNACRYGGSRLAVTAKAPNGMVEVAVEDDGPGVPRRFEQVIFDRFERGDHRLDAHVPGSGLGLAIARSLVVAQGGRIGYRSSEELGGACFWFALPAAVSRSKTIRPEALGASPRPPIDRTLVAESGSPRTVAHGFAASGSRLRWFVG